jgi:hypothetical protein
MFVDFNYRMWGIGMVMPLWLWNICKTMYVALDALMETLGILWKVNWLGMVAMLCLLACHEAKVNAWTSMLLIFKLVLPTCHIIFSKEASTTLSKGNFRPYVNIMASINVFYQTCVHSLLLLWINYSSLTFQIG